MQFYRWTLFLFTVFYLSLSLADSDEQLRAKKADPWAISTASNIHTTYRKSNGDIYNQADTAVKLTNARVLIADYDLIRLDFEDVKDFNDVQIDKWLLDNYAYIALGQTKPNDVNTPIPVDASKTKTVSRPEDYGRAVRIDHRYKTLVDVKGAGTRKPIQASHGNGLMTLGEALREYTFEGMVSDILYVTKSNWRTVGSYAVIDPGFNVIHTDGSQSRAGLYLRQGVKRLYTWIGGDDWDFLVDIFKKFGISLEDNLQGTSASSGSGYGNYVIDFGHYVVDPDFATRIGLPLNVWGPEPWAKKIEGERWSLSKQDIPWTTFHRLAQEFVDGKANRDNVWETYRHFINSFRNYAGNLDVMEINPSCDAAVMKEMPQLLSLQ